jgi:hypothetical protein
MLPPVRSKSVRAAVGVVGIAVLVVAAPACTDRSADTATSSTTPAATQPITRHACETAVPATWQKVIDDSAVNTGGVSNVPMAVGKRGEVAVARDNGDTRDLLLVGADKSVSEIYSVPEPDQNWIGVVALDDRWVVAGIEYAPRAANGIIPTIMRIEVIDRQGGPVRTAVESPMEDRRTGGRTIDSVALFGGKVYWITRDTFAGDAGKIQSYDLNTGSVTDVASGEMRNVRTTAAGLVWDVAWDQNTGTRSELKIPDALPPEVAGAVGAGRDQFTLVTDGNAYAWASGSDHGEPGLAYWSPNSGLVRITGNMPQAGKHQPLPLHVVGPYVVIDRGRPGSDYETYATIVDTRSGALTYLRPSVGGAEGGTIAVGLGADIKELPPKAGVVRVDALPPLSC